MKENVPYPTGPEWRQRLGPFLSQGDAADALQIDEAGLHRLASEGALLSVLTESSEQLYPAFQFHDGGTLPALKECLSLLSETRLSAYTILSWFLSPSEFLDGKTPATWLAEGRDPDRVLALANTTQARLRA